MKKTSKKSKVLKSLAIAGGVATFVASSSIATATALSTKNVASNITAKQSSSVATENDTKVSAQPQATVTPRASSFNGTTTAKYSTAVGQWYNNSALWAATYAYKFANDFAGVEDFVQGHLWDLFNNIEGIDGYKDVHVRQNSIRVNNTAGTVTLSIYFTAINFNGNLMICPDESKDFTMTFTGFKKFTTWDYSEGIADKSSWFKWKDKLSVKGILPADLLNQLKEVKTDDTIKTRLTRLNKYLAIGPLPIDLPSFQMTVDGLANNVTGSLDLIIKTNAVFQEVNQDGEDFKVITTSDFTNNPFIFEVASTASGVTFERKGITKVPSTLIDLTTSTNPDIQRVCNGKDLVDALKKKSVKVTKEIKNIILSLIVPPQGIAYKDTDLDFDLAGMTAEPASGIVNLPVTIKNYVSINSSSDKQVTFVIKVNTISVPVVEQAKTFPMLYNVKEAVKLLKADVKQKSFAEQKFINQFINVSGVNYSKIKVQTVTETDLDVASNSVKLSFTIKDMPNVEPGGKPTSTQTFGPFLYEFYNNKLATSVDSSITLSPQDKLKGDTLVSTVYPYQLDKNGGSTYPYDAEIRQFLMDRAVNNKAVIKGKEVVIDPTQYSPNDITITSITEINNAKGSIKVDYRLSKYLYYDSGNRPVLSTAKPGLACTTVINGFRKAYAPTSAQIDPNYVTEFSGVLPSELRKQIENATKAKDETTLLNIMTKLLNVYNSPYTDDHGKATEPDKLKKGLQIRVLSDDNKTGQIQLKYLYPGRFNDDSLLSYNPNGTWSQTYIYNFLDAYHSPTQITGEVEANNTIYASYLAEDMSEKLKTDDKLKEQVKNDILPSIKYAPTDFTIANIKDVRVDPGDANYNNDEKWVTLKVDVTNFYDGAGKSPDTSGNVRTLTTKFKANFRHIEPTRFNPGVYTTPDARDKLPTDWYTENGEMGIKKVLAQKIKEQKDNPDTAQKIILGDFPKGVELDASKIVIKNVKPDNRRARITLEASLTNYWDYDEASGTSTQVTNLEGYKPFTPITLRGYYSSDVTIIPADNTRFEVTDEFKGFYPSDLTFEGNDFTIEKLQNFIYTKGRNPDGTTSDECILDGKLPANPATENVIIQDRLSKGTLTFIGQPNDKDGTLKIKVHLNQIATLDKDGNKVNIDPHDPSETDFTIILWGFKKRIPTTVVETIKNEQVSPEFKNMIPSEVADLNKDQGKISQILYDATTKKIKQNTSLISGEIPEVALPSLYKTIPPTALGTIAPIPQIVPTMPTSPWPDPWLAAPGNNVAENNRVVVNEIPTFDNLAGTYNISLLLNAWYDEDDGLPTYASFTDEFTKGKPVNVLVTGAESITATGINPVNPYEVSSSSPVSKKIPQGADDVIGKLAAGTALNPEEQEFADALRQEILDNLVTGTKRNITKEDIQLVPMPGRYNNKQGTIEISFKVPKYWDSKGNFIDTAVDTSKKPLEATLTFTGLRKATPTNPYEGTLSVRAYPFLTTLTPKKIVDYVTKPGTYTSPDAVTARDKVGDVLWEGSVKRAWGDKNSNTDMMTKADIEIVTCNEGATAGASRDSVVIEYKLKRYWDEDANFVSSPTGPAKLYKVTLSGFKIGNATEIVSDFNLYGKLYSNDVGGGLKFGIKLLDEAVLDGNAKLIKWYENNSDIQNMSVKDWVDALGDANVKEIIKQVLVLNQDFMVDNAPPKFDEAVAGSEITYDAPNPTDGFLQCHINLIRSVAGDGTISTSPRNFDFKLHGFAKSGATTFIEDKEIPIAGDLQSVVNTNKIIATSVQKDASGNVVAGKLDITDQFKVFLRENVITGYAPAAKITANDIKILGITDQSNIKTSLTVNFQLDKYYDASGALKDVSKGDAPLTHTITLTGFYTMESKPTIPPQNTLPLSTGLKLGAAGDSGTLYSYFFTNDGLPKFTSNVFDPATSADKNPSTTSAEAIANLKKWIILNTTGTKDGITPDDVEFLGGDETAFSNFNLLKGSVDIQYRLSKTWGDSGPQPYPSRYYALTITGFKEAEVTAVNPQFKVGDIFSPAGQSGVTKEFIAENADLIEKMRSIAIEEILENESEVTLDQLKQVLLSYIYNNTVGDTAQKILKNVPTPSELTKDDFAIQAQYIKNGDLTVRASLRKYYNEKGKTIIGTIGDTSDWFTFEFSLTGFAKNEPTSNLIDAKLDITKNANTNTNGKVPLYYKELYTILDPTTGSKFYWKDSTPTALRRSIREASDGKYSLEGADRIISETIRNFILEDLVINNSGTTIQDIEINLDYNDAIGQITVSYVVKRGYQMGPNGVAKLSPMNLRGKLVIFGFKKDNKFETSNLITILTYSLAGVGVFCLLAIILFIVYKRRRDIEYRQ